MAHIKIEVYLYAESKELDTHITEAVSDERLGRQFAVDAALGLRDSVAEYLGMTRSRHEIDYDVEVLQR
jgi:hypothetical protein